MKKGIGIISCIIGILLAVIGVVMKVKGTMAVSIIGGACNLISVFVAGKLNGSFLTLYYCRSDCIGNCFACVLEESLKSLKKRSGK